ncbi:MAG TPA: hypothetical protein VG797_04670, partial [Phycisphaerales bacterium]|nr:hypothetical protein [Phycisphaerales bacterium]
MTPAVLASIDPSSNEFSGIAWSPACGAALIVMLSLGVIAAGAWGVWKTRRGAGALGARVAAAIGLGAILFGPVQFERVPDESARPAVAYLLDTSSSMALSDQPGPDGDHAICTRIDAIRRSWLASEAIREVDNAADLRLIGFDERPTPMTLERARSMDPIGERTRLVESVGAVLGGFANGGASTTDSGPPGRVSDAVLFTDGADTDGTPLGALAGAALASGVRLHAVAVGKDVRPSDISIQASADSALVYDGQPTTLRIRIRQSGFDRRPARLTVREITGDAASTDQQGRLIHAETIVLEHSNDLAVSVTPSRPPSQGETPVSNGGGTALIEYIASVEPLAGEADATNNTRSTFVQVSGARIRVCVFEAEPYWDSRFFIAAMRDDPQVELTTVIGLGAVRQGERTEPRVIVTRSIPGPTRGHEERLDNVPLADDELAQFDVIALGKGVEMFFPGDEARKLVRYAAERGGSLVFLRGKPITHTDAPATEAARILGAVSPVEWGAIALRGSKLARTDEGRRQPVLDFERLGPSDAILTELPGMLAATSVERERALSVVWLRQVQGESGAGSGPVVGDPAALAHMSVGQGRSLAVLADGMWRWA